MVGRPRRGEVERLSEVVLSLQQVHKLDEHYTYLHSCGTVLSTRTNAKSNGLLECEHSVQQYLA